YLTDTLITTEPASTISRLEEMIGKLMKYNMWYSMSTMMNLLMNLQLFDISKCNATSEFNF
ncbi:hypothetical protein GWI33_010471, partial [Rhynchophorus ferrugineus]